MKDRIVDAIPWHIGAGPSVAAAGALNWAAETIGRYVEDLGQNRGRILSRELLAPYAQHHRIDSAIDLPWCAIWATAAWSAGLGGYDPGSAPADWANDWRAHPLGDWLGAARSIERAGKRAGLWVPAVDLSARAPGARIAGALLVRDRLNSGSDAARAAPRGLWPGHVDLAVCWLPSGKILAIGANLSDEVRAVEREISDRRFHGAVLFPPADLDEEEERQPVTTIPNFDIVAGGSVTLDGVTYRVKLIAGPTAILKPIPRGPSWEVSISYLLARPGLVVNPPRPPRRRQPRRERALPPLPTAEPTPTEEPMPIPPAALTALRVTAKVLGHIRRVAAAVRPEIEQALTDGQVDLIEAEEIGAAVGTALNDEIKGLDIFSDEARLAMVAHIGAAVAVGTADLRGG